MKVSKSLGQLKKVVIQQAMPINMNTKPYKTDRMHERANEIEKTTQKKNVKMMSDIIRLHDKTVNKGLKVAKK
jgi:hypothetical protein